VTAYPRQHHRVIRHAQRRARRYRRGHRRNRLTPRQAIGAAVAFVIAIGALGGGTSQGRAVIGEVTGLWRPAPAAMKAIGFAETQAAHHCPYQWGGVGPCGAGFDCSGLVMMAYQSAGVDTVPRTTSEQWASLPHVHHPQPGDLVLIVGADGTWASPGHVGIVTDPATRTMVEAWSTGYPVWVSHYGPAASPGSGDQNVVGYVRPVSLVRGAAAMTGDTPTSWAQALLADLRAPPTRCNLTAVLAWEGAEGGNWHNPAAYNPLNTTLKLPGSRGAVQTQNPAVWVQAYTSWAQGMTATLASLRVFPAIGAALRQGGSAQAVAQAVVTPNASGHTWGTSPFNPGSC
jgi:hypothetical protein